MDIDIEFSELSSTSISNIIDNIINQLWIKGLKTRYAHYEDAISDSQLRKNIEHEIWNKSIKINLSNIN